MSASISPVAKVSSRVVRVLGMNPGPMTLQGSNTYLVGTGPERLLVDSGEGRPQYLDVLQKALTAESQSLGRPVTISHLFLTHWHQDHVGGVAALHSLYPDAVIYKKPSAYQAIPEDALCVPPPPVLALEGSTVRVVPAPGHTDDHLCLFLEEEQALFTGDTILGTGTSVFACYTDYLATLHSLKTYAAKLLYPAHGPVVTAAAARIDEIIAHRQMREAQILSALAAAGKGRCVMDLVMDIYAATTPESLWEAAAVNVYQQVKKLIRERAVVVEHCPTMEPELLGDASDYASLGEGARTNAEEKDAIFYKLIVALPQQRAS